MLYREIIAVCFQIHKKHINTLCGQNVELLSVKSYGKRHQSLYMVRGLVHFLLSINLFLQFSLLTHATIYRYASYE